MPQPKTPEAWRQLVFSCLAEDERMPPSEIQKRLEDAAKENPDWQRIHDRLPSVRTIERIRAEFKPKSDSEKAPYRLFSWPESMERGDLPWEAGAAALELLSFQKAGRPTIRQARWFWRVSMAAPDLGIYERLDLARGFASLEAVGVRTEEGVRGLEGYLRFAPWRSDENEQLYNGLVERGVVPPVLKR